MDPKISHIQLRGLIVSITIGVGVLSMQSDLVKHMGSDGWLGIIAVGLISVLTFSIYYNIFRLYPNKDYFQIGRLTVGPAIFKIFKFIYILYYIVLLSVVARTLGELIKIFLLPSTPLEVIVLTFILATTYLASYEIDKVSRAAYFVYPIIILFVLVTVLIAIPGADTSNLLPVFQTDITGAIKGLGVSFFSFFGLEIVLLAIPFVEQKEKIFRTGIYAITIVTAIYIATFVMTLTNFSQEQIIGQNYPVLVLIRQLDLPGLFLENLDGLVMAIWVLVVFATMAPAYFALGKFASKLFDTKSHKYFVLGSLPIIYTIAMLPENFLQLMGQLTNVYYAFALLSAYIIPLIILGTGAIRKRVSK